MKTADLIDSYEEVHFCNLPFLKWAKKKVMPKKRWGSPIRRNSGRASAAAQEFKLRSSTSLILAPPMLTSKCGSTSMINGRPAFDPGVAVGLHKHNCEERS